MKIKEGYVLREVAGNSIVVAIGKEAINFNALITINETAAFLWKLLAEKDMTKDELLEAVLAEYETDRATACADIDEFTSKLAEADLLV